MKTGRKLLALTLCLMMVLGLSTTAFAAKKTSAEDIAKEFMALLDKDGVEYSDEGLNDANRYEIDITYEGENVEEHFIVLYINEDGQGFGASEWYLMDYDEEDLLDVLMTVNQLNKEYRYVTFLADTDDNTITAKMTGALQGDAKQAAKVLHYAYDWLPLVLDDAWPTLEEGVLGLSSKT